MDQYTERQILINRRRDEMVARYPSLWDKLIAEWKSPGSDDRAWLIYSANYLFCTQGVRWAMDPLALQSRIPQAPRMDVARDLKDLDFVLLTHRHKDHMDSGLLRALRHLPIQWVVPEAMFQLVQGEIGLPTRQILVPQLMQPMEISGLRITSFDGLHWEAAPDYPTGRRGVPATGYLVEQGNKRWLFPGDTRRYHLPAIPDLGPVDVLFAHLWFGRRAAHQSPPPLLEHFCRFCLALKPHRIILAHLEEWGRKAADFWDLEHAKQAVRVLRQQAPSFPIQNAFLGDSLLLE